MAAHLHRYAAELRSFEEIVTDIDIHHKSILGQTQDMPRYLFDRVETGLYQVASQLHSIKSFEMELEKKIQNILALVCHFRLFNL
jgi:septin family protein